MKFLLISALIWCFIFIIEELLHGDNPPNYVLWPVVGLFFATFLGAILSSLGLPTYVPLYTSLASLAAILTYTYFKKK